MSLPRRLIHGRGLGSARLRLPRVASSQLCMTAAAVCKLTYFPLWAKGPGPALALAHSGLPWRGFFVEDWATMKPTTTWSKLPLLEVPTAGQSSMVIGHELAILSWISRAAPALGGTTDGDCAISDQLLCESEDIYAKLTKSCPTTRQPHKCSYEELRALWARAPDMAVHNREQGLHANLALLDAFAGTCGAAGGRFTATGVTVGECKLFATLHTLVLMEPDVLQPHGRLDTFYHRFASLDQTRTVLETGGEMPSRFVQYFVRGTE